MKKINYKNILIFITFTILSTFGLQIYWNIKNYQENKQNLYREVVAAFDKSIDYYYLEDLKNDNVVILNSSKIGKMDFKYINLKSILDSKNDKSNGKHPTFTLNQNDTTINLPSKIKKTILVFKGKKSVDSIARLKQLSNIIISIQRDSINLAKISKALKLELNRKKITIKFSLEQLNLGKIIQKYDLNKVPEHEFSALSNSIDIPRNDKLRIHFFSSNLDILKRGLIEILISIILSVLLLSCVFYLLKIINKQKQIAEIKNDFISNISHELKTPIAIVSSAIEGIEKFNIENDPQKTKRYLNISNHELSKLNFMVEKILETASLESNELQLKKELVDLVDLIQKCVEKQQISTLKEIKFINNFEISFAVIDVFHFENVISNCIENAIKYGGNKIEIELNIFEKSTEIEIRDNGNGIPKIHQKKIFDKFYRIPTQNIHDIKGFGIGLYYVQQIIEKHLGTVDFIPNEDWTIFKITLPND